MLAFAVIVEVIDWLRVEFPNENFDPSQQRVADQLYANLQPAKTLEELQMQPQDYLLGYEQHHIVEENRDNVAKDSVRCRAPVEVRLRRPSKTRLISPGFRASKHEQITAEYNSKYLDNPKYPLTRDVVDRHGF